MTESGPAMTAPADRHQLGRAGEYLAAYILEANGVECHRVDRRGDDLWCKLPNGRLVTVQVKATKRPVVPRSSGMKGERSTYYRFHTDTVCEADWYIFVALDLELIRLMPSSEVIHKNTSIAPRQFNANAQAADLALFLDQPKVPV